MTLRDAAELVAALRDEGHEVLIHCVAAQSRTPAVGIAYAMLRGVDHETATNGVCSALPSASPNGGFRSVLTKAAGVSPVPRCLRRAATRPPTTSDIAPEVKI